MANTDYAGPQPAAVLFLAFNRPAHFARVLQAVRASGPRKLFISIDGPRHDRPGEGAQVRQVRELAEGIDWATEVHLKAPEKNQGCGPAVSSAISWALSQVPEVIILEDDCLPDPSFLRFCDELLERHRHDERVMQICGTNWGASPERFEGHSYAFTSFAPIWGWATWRRAWDLYDYELASWPRVKASGLVKGMAVSPRFRRLLERDWERVLAGHGTWDHQWQYSVLRHHGLSVCPKRNLVQNIGFTGDGTQITEPDRIFSRLPLERLDFPLEHPPEVARSASVEAVYESVYWQKLGWPMQLFRWLVRNPALSRAIRGTLRNILPRPA